MRILWISDLVSPTGFSRVSHSIIKHLPKDVEVYGLGINYRGDPQPYGFPIFPATLNNPGDIYGMGRLKEMVRFQPDIIFLLNDPWIVNNYLEKIKEEFKNHLPRIVTYLPVDGEKLVHGYFEHFDVVDKVVAYTEFGKRVILEAKAELEDKISIIPHGIDKEVFFQMSKDQARQILFGPSYEKVKDAFIVLSANRNQPRKRLDLTMKGFSWFALDKPDTRLYMHCGLVDASINIGELSLRYGIDSKLIATGTAPGIQRVPETHLNIIYNACDVGVNTSVGEGWGLTNIEHAITGAPQVVPNHSACSEVFGDVGLLTDVYEDPVTNDNVLTEGRLIKLQSYADNLDRLYNDKELYKSLSEKSIEKFSREEYQWQNIAKVWYNLFVKTLEA